MATTQPATTPKIVLYTNHGCPFCHRVHIALNELGIPFEEHLIDLNTPRPQWYLDINPKGSVPTLQYTVPGLFEKETITEPAIIAQFLCDAFPSHLLPAADGKDPKAALTRARINTFLDTWNSKFAGTWFPIMMLPTEEAKEAKVGEWVASVEKDLEPLLQGAKPFFGGSEEMTFVEVIAGPVVLKLYILSAHGEVLPSSLAKKLDALPNFGPWAAAIRGKKSVSGHIDPEAAVDGMKKLVAKMKAPK